MQNTQKQWLLCPVCNHKTRIKLRQDTVIEKLPLYCPKCRKEILVNEEQKADTFGGNRKSRCRRAGSVAVSRDKKLRPAE